MSDLTLEHLLASLNASSIEKTAEENKTPEIIKEAADATAATSAATPSSEGAALAQEIMTKVANLNIESIPGMNKTAADKAGKELANELMKKLAGGPGDTNTDNGIPAGVAPGKPATDNATMKAEDDGKVKPMPTSDGTRPQGSINEIFDAIIADTMSQGAASKDQVAVTGVSSHEGAAEARAMPNQVHQKMAALQELTEGGMDFSEAVELIKQAELEHNDQLEKVAAVQTLVENGIDFDTASDLVKEAAIELAKEAETLTKAAAVQELINQGMDFDEAVTLVKAAGGPGDTNTSDGLVPGTAPGKHQEDNARMVSEDDGKIKPMLTSDGTRPQGTINEIFDAVVADVLAQGAASKDQVVGGGVASKEGNAEAQAMPNQVDGLAKAAAMAKFIEAGMDFEKAAEAVQEAVEKSAGFMSAIKGAAGMAKSTAGKAAAGLKGAATKTNPISGAKELKGLSSMSTGAKVGLAAAGGAAAGAGAAKAMQEKKAEAMNLLLEQGVDFDEATRLVKEAATKLGV